MFFTDFFFGTLSDMSCDLSIDTSLVSRLKSAYVSAKPTTPKPSQPSNLTAEIKYGKVAGSVTYYYNAYRGNVADTGALVYLLPKNGNAKNISDQNYKIYKIIA